MGPWSCERISFGIVCNLDGRMKNLERLKAFSYKWLIAIQMAMPLFELRWHWLKLNPISHLFFEHHKFVLTRLQKTLG